MGEFAELYGQDLKAAAERLLSQARARGFIVLEVLPCPDGVELLIERPDGKPHVEGWTLFAVFDRALLEKSFANLRAEFDQISQENGDGGEAAE